LSTARSLLLATALLFVLPSAHADPEVDYLLHCSGCHMPDGSGLAPVVPTLHDAIGRLLAEPEGRSYIVRVPGVSQAPISDEKLTAVLNWMLIEFSSETLPEDFKPLTVKEVKRARAQLLADPLKYRAAVFPDY
jgi:mono/diheme cytochrome c family protein